MTANLLGNKKKETLFGRGVLPNSKYGASVHMSTFTLQCICKWDIQKKSYKPENSSI